MAAISARHRVRAAFVGGLAAMFVGFLAAGDRVVLAVGVCTAIGALVGHAHRRHWGAVRTVATGIVLFWPPASLVTVGLLAAFTTSRRLPLTRPETRGAGPVRPFAICASVGSLTSGTSWSTGRPGSGGWSFPLRCSPSWGRSSDLEWCAARGTLHTLDGLGGPRSLLFDVQDRRAPAPVPVRMDDVSFRYPGSEHWAVRHVALQLEPSEFLTIVGHNGSGKSTLARMLVGAVPTEGTITRGGAPGLGARDGSALIFQRPDAQVLGVHVRDDLRWGLPSTRVVDTEDLLARVGLGGFSDRETATLSGGELQRLAVASALARQPRLVVSDESTAMLDPEGRVVLMNLLRSLPDEGVSVVHVTHDPLEASAAPHALALSNGRRVDHVTPIATPSIQPSLPSTHRPPPQTLSLKGVGHVYSPGTPWERRSLAAVNLEIAPGSGVAVNGPNGSGKSTLAWILAGLTLPTEGEMLLGGRSLAEQVGRVGLSFQHARLQLLQRRVLDDVRDAGGSDDATAADALWSVGLDPSVFGSRQVDQLSGGEQRRVAIAGMLARQTSVLVLDEPFAGLDKAGSLQLVQVLAHLRAEWGITLIIVSHDNVFVGGDRRSLHPPRSGSGRQRLRTDAAPSRSLDCIGQDQEAGQ